MNSNGSLPVEIAGLGRYLPERVLDNHELERMVDTSDEWIVQRTGISERRLAADHEATSDLAIAAARQALEAAEIEGAELDAVLVATCTPDYSFPATACLVQSALGADRAFGADLEAACSGFLFGLSWATSLISAGMARNVLLVGAETLSRFTDYTDRRSCILFGDGAGAAVLRASTNGGEVLYTELGCDGSWPEILTIPAGGSRHPASHKTVDGHKHFMYLHGREVFKLAVNKLIELIQRLPEKTGIGLDEIKLVIPHQSNVRIIRSAMERTGLDMGRSYVNIDRVGNTSAASIPIAMSEATEEGRLERGDLVLLLAFGGGITWGSALIRY
jgi:3-oxoacyl-[acyl-carrier-protein] synthase-3